MKSLLPGVVILVLAAFAPAQTTQAIKDADPVAAINALRTDLVDSFNKGDLNRLLSHLEPDVIVTWQNGEVCRGPEEVRAYYNKMMTGPDKIVAAIAANPVVTDRHNYGNFAVSWGVMNDRFTLTDGRVLDMNSKFTATIVREGEEWKIASFHVSVNAFDNPILGIAIHKTSTWLGLLALAALVLGLVVGRLIKRKPAKA